MFLDCELTAGCAIIVRSYKGLHQQQLLIILRVIADLLMTRQEGRGEPAGIVTHTKQIIIPDWLDTAKKNFI